MTEQEKFEMLYNFGKFIAWLAGGVIVVWKVTDAYKTKVTEKSVGAAKIAQVLEKIGILTDDVNNLRTSDANLTEKIRDIRSEVKDVFQMLINFIKPK